MYILNFKVNLTLNFATKHELNFTNEDWNKYALGSLQLFSTLKKRDVTRKRYLLKFSKAHTPNNT